MRLIFVYDIMLFSRYLRNVKGNIALFAHSQFGAVQNVKSGREIWSGRQLRKQAVKSALQAAV